MIKNSREAKTLMRDLLRAAASLLLLLLLFISSIIEYEITLHPKTAQLQ